MYTALQDARQAAGTVDIFYFLHSISITENSVAMSFHSVMLLTCHLSGDIK